MLSDVKKKWIDALVSGRFEQGEGQLCEELPHGESYCCLGVLARIVDPSRSMWYNTQSTFGDRGGQPELIGELPRATIDDLVALNDAQKLTFPQIAWYIDKRVPVDALVAPK